MLQKRLRGLPDSAYARNKLFQTWFRTWLNTCTKNGEAQIKMQFEEKLGQELLNAKAMMLCQTPGRGYEEANKVCHLCPPNPNGPTKEVDLNIKGKSLFSLSLTS